MTGQFHRRAVLGGLLAGVAAPALAGAPSTSLRPPPRGGWPPPDYGEDLGRATVERMIRETNLSGRVAYAVVDVETGEMLANRQGMAPMPPASVAKALTTLYALDRLGHDHRFTTEVVTTGPVEDGVVKGDLALVGSGDPGLDTDDLYALAQQLKEAGIRAVDGRFLVWGGAIPTGPMIDPDQPVQVGYNPSFGGLNLNFNRVHFEWARKSGDYTVTMEARGERASPATALARMEIVDRRGPVYDYRADRGVDAWSVSRGALGTNGARWLPVRHPAAYAADVFRTLMRSHGIVLDQAEFPEPRPSGRTLASRESAPLSPMLKSMLKHSTNLTAEVTGLSATVAGQVPCATLADSGAAMNLWLRRTYGVGGISMTDHSGLGYHSRVTANALARVMASASETELPGLLKVFSVDGLKDGTVVAKTGTLNFVSALSGYLVPPSGRRVAFAILMADVERRNAIPPEKRERPDGARPYEARARTLQRAMLAHWARAAASV